jgi:hypothetical protein
MIELFDEADLQVAFYLEHEYKNWKDEIPNVREFLSTIQTKTIEQKIKTSTVGNTLVRMIPGKLDLDDLQEV